MDLRGTIPPMVTPVQDRSGTIAVDELRRLTERLVSGGVHGVFPCGTTGEFASLSPSARERAVRTVADATDSVPVLAGCGSTSRSGATTLIADAADAGADAAVVVTPYYHAGSQAGIEEFYLDVADDAELPILLYHIPQVTGQELSPDTVVSLADHPSIVGVKDSSGDSGYLYELVRTTPDEFAVLCGDVANARTVLSMGADGIVPGQGNYMPEALATVYDAHAAGNHDRMTDALQRVNEISRLFADIPLIPALKYLTTYAGYDVGPPLPPLSELDDRQKERLRTRFDDVMQ